MMRACAAAGRQQIHPLASRPERCESQRRAGVRAAVARAHHAPVAGKRQCWPRTRHAERVRRRPC
eukprot:5211484-Prymnesium_polylepis.2